MNVKQLRYLNDQKLGARLEFMEVRSNFEAALNERVRVRAALTRFTSDLLFASFLDEHLSSIFDVLTDPAEEVAAMRPTPEELLADYARRVDDWTPSHSSNRVEREAREQEREALRRVRTVLTALVRAGGEE